MAINIADPDINPLITGWLRNHAKNPRRKKPAASSITPDSSARRIDSETYSADPCDASGISALAVINEETATGPTASVMLLPNRA